MSSYRRLSREYIDAIGKKARKMPVGEDRSNLVEVYRALDALRRRIDELE